MDEIKSTYRLPLNERNEPAHIPIHYEVHIGLDGLREGDKDALGFFWYEGYSNIEFVYNTNSKFIVLHVGFNFNKIKSVSLFKVLVSKYCKNWSGKVFEGVKNHVSKLVFGPIFCLRKFRSIKLWIKL